MNENYDIQHIESALADYVKSINLSKYVFEGQRPSKTTEAMATFIVVSVPSGVIDLAAYGSTTARIEMFVSNNADGTKKSKVFSTMHQKLAQSFPIRHDKYLFDTHPTILSLGNDGNGYHIQALNIHILIKTI